MQPSYPGFFKWSKLDSDDEFDSIVEVLLARRFRVEGCTVVSYNGSGGDKGRDVVVTYPDGTTRIFQLKFFPGGFPGGGSRRGQITKSFQAMLQHHPVEWTLVVPENLKQGEMVFRDNLAKLVPNGQALKITSWGRTELDDALSAEPEVRAAFEKDSLAELVDRYGVERRIWPTTPDDVDDRIAHVQQAIDSADPDWSWTFSTVPGEQRRTLTPLHDLASQRSPVEIHVQTDTSKISTDLQRQIRAVYEFGAAGEVEIPEEAVTRFEVKGPPIVAEVSEHMVVIFGRRRSVPHGLRRCELVVLNGDGLSVSSNVGALDHVGRGATGVSVVARFGALTLEMDLPEDPDAGVDTRLSCEFRGRSMSDIVDACDLYLQICESSSLRLTLADKTVLGLRSGGQPDGEPVQAVQYTRGIAVDLLVIQAAFKTRFPLPETHTRDDRRMARALRLIIEGKRTTLPSVDSLPFAFSREHAAQEAIARMVDGELLPIWSTGSDVSIEVFGQRVTFGQLTVGDLQVELDNAAEAKADLASSVDVVRSRLRPGGGRLFTAFSSDYVEDESTALPLVLWGLADDEEPGIPGPDRPAAQPPAPRGRRELVQP